MDQILLCPPKTTLWVLHHCHIISMQSLNSNPKPNLNKDELKTLKQLRADKDHIILTTDNSVGLILMDRQDYIKKARNLLEDTNTYRPIQADPTNKHKAKLINILQNIKAEIGMSENIYRKIHPTGASSPRFYGLPKNHNSPKAHCIKHWLCNI